MMNVLRKVGRWLLDSFRLPTEDEALSLHSALVSYETQRNGMRQRRTDILPIGHDEALQLSVGVPYLMRDLIVCPVYERGCHYCLVYGDSYASADRRARQLVDALDGARRL